MYFERELLRFADGREVKNIEDFKIRKKEILDILARHAYGYLPKDEIKTSIETISSDTKCCSGHAILNKINFVMESKNGTYKIKANYFKQNDDKKHPLILLLNFRPDAYDMYYPIEEIIDNGFSFISVCYNDISLDDKDAKNDGLESILDEVEEKAYKYGKISLWAFAASRMLDAILKLEEIDASNIAIAGHSRLGKTALWCGANDERFKFILSNDSGCMGDALNQIKHGGSETVSSIKTVFPHWFCPYFQQYNDEKELPFDQHWLIAAIAPRFVATGASSLDLWADPISEELSAIGASKAWELYNLKGYVHGDEQIKINQCFGGGHIQHHYRDGIHFFGRQDWLYYMSFIKANLNN
jgi:hypothetical protein